MIKDVHGILVGGAQLAGTSDEDIVMQSNMRIAIEKERSRTARAAIAKRKRVAKAEAKADAKKA